MVLTSGCGIYLLFVEAVDSVEAHCNVDKQVLKDQVRVMSEPPSHPVTQYRVDEPQNQVYSINLRS